VAATRARHEFLHLFFSLSFFLLPNPITHSNSRLPLLDINLRSICSSPPLWICASFPPIFVSRNVRGHQCLGFSPELHPCGLVALFRSPPLPTSDPPFYFASCPLTSQADICPFAFPPVWFFFDFCIFSFYIACPTSPFLYDPRKDEAARDFIFSLNTPPPNSAAH